MSVSMWCNEKQCDLYGKVVVARRESTYKHGDNVLLDLVCDNFSKNHDKCIIWSVNVSESQSERVQCTTGTVCGLLLTMLLGGRKQRRATGKM
jgi:hypothetical protein